VIIVQVRLLDDQLDDRLQEAVRPGRVVRFETPACFAGGTGPRRGRRRHLSPAGWPSGGTGRHLRWLRDALGSRFALGLVLHTGPRAFRLDESIAAMPVCALWG
jgi:hypothetical protein